MRRFIIVVLVLALLVAAAWAAAWRFVTGRVETAVTDALAGSAEAGIYIACDRREQRGFPFRVEVVCADAVAQPAAENWNATLAGLRAGAWFYRPRTIEAVLQGPFELHAEALSQPATAEWERATAEAAAGLDGLRSLSATFTRPIAQAAGTEVATDRTTFSVSPAAAGDGSRVQLRADRLRLPSSEAMPPVDVTFEARTPVPPEALLGGDVDLSGGLEVSDIALGLETGPVQAFAQGGLAFGPDGVANGSLDLYLVGIENLPALLGVLPGEAGSAGNVLVGALLALAVPAEWRGRPARRITLNVEDGAVRAGTLPLGRLPPLWPPPASS